MRRRSAPILRDICALRDQGYLIHSDPGRGGGLRLDPQSVQMASRLSVTKVFARLIGVAAMRAAGSLPLPALADSGLAKIEKFLPAEKLRDLRRLFDCLCVVKLAPQRDLTDLGGIDPALLPAVETGFLERLQLRFLYRDAKGTKTARFIEPQALRILPSLRYLLGWDSQRQGIRHFRMDRITQPQIIAEAQFARRHVPFEKDICPYSALPQGA